MAHAPAVIQLDAQEDAQIAQDIAIAPQANAAPAAAQQAQPYQYISPQDFRANITALAARLAIRTEFIEVTRVGRAVEQANIVQRKSHTGHRKQAHPKHQQLCCLRMNFIHTMPTSVELNTNSLTYALRRGLDPQGITI